MKMSANSIANLTDDDLAQILASSESSEEVDRCLKELSIRLMPKLRAHARCLDLGGAEAEYAAQTVFDEHILRLCRQYDPGQGAFFSYALSTLKRELKGYREKEWSDIHIPHNVRRKHRHVHHLAKQYHDAGRQIDADFIAKETKQTPDYVRFLLTIDNMDALSRSSHPEDISVCLEESGHYHKDEDPCEKIDEDLTLRKLMKEFDQILSPVEKYVFCRKTGIEGEEASCITIQKEPFQHL